MNATLQSRRLAGLLREHGVGDADASGRAAWEAFKAYGREVFGLDGVGLLFQAGTYDFDGQARFHFDPVCQFEGTGPDGDFLEQLHCRLTCAPDGALAGVQDELWSFDFPSADAFFAAVEALPAFRAAVARDDYAVSVVHERV